ncbi:MAG: endonuclease [Bacteroidetes bacterium]|nr:endonuclease [Bacteroidota bacterium]
MKNIAVAFALLPTLTAPAFAQHQSVFPALTGDELLDNLVTDFKPTSLLPQAAARDTLFGKIYRYHDSLTCVYTGYRIYLDANEDPTQAAFAKGINTEHTFPQSLGATGVAEGDMHHLYPTREDANAARGNSPFAEIADNQTEEWYYLGQQTTSVPGSNIDLYSEWENGFFEPREDHKGNVARAMFYFYTMYKAQADLANSTFFESQRPTLCAWHFLDPVDGAEWDRTWRIAPYQSGKPNPFVLDCTLPERCYCEEFALACTPVGVLEQTENEWFTLEQNAPNPFREATVFRYTLHRPGEVRLEVFNALGEKTDVVEFGWQAAGGQSFFWVKNVETAPGISFFRLVFTNGNNVSTATGKMAILP